MSKVPELSETIDLPDKIRDAGPDAKLVLFIGAGISQLAGYPSWNEFADKALNELREKKFMNCKERSQLATLDPKTKLSIARLIAKKNNYDLDFTKHFTGKNESDSIYKAINDIGCPCVTTNYDELLAPRFLEKKDGSATTAPLNRVCESEKFHEDLLSDPGTVIHLHGSISKPETMIVTTEDYLKIYDDENVQNLLSALFKKHTILFLGYSLEEKEILEHILRRGSAEKIKYDQKMFALQGFSRNKKYLYQNIYNYYAESFGVYLLGFPLKDNDFHCQEKIIQDWMQTLRIRKPSLSKKYQSMCEILSDG